MFQKGGQLFGGVSRGCIFEPNIFKVENGAKDLAGFLQIFDFFGQTGNFFKELTFLIFIAELTFHEQNFTALNFTENKNLRIISRSSCLASRAYFPFFLMIFKTALVSIIFILELSVLDKSCLELNFQAIRAIPRVPCTAVFLRSSTFNSLSDFFDNIYNSSSFYNIHPRIKRLR